MKKILQKCIATAASVMMALVPMSGTALPTYAESQELIDLTERLTAGCTEVHLRHLEEIFMVCSRYEMAFWDMAWEMRH